MKLQENSTIAEIIARQEAFEEERSASMMLRQLDDKLKDLEGELIMLMGVNRQLTADLQTKAELKEVLDKAPLFFRDGVDVETRSEYDGPETKIDPEAGERTMKFRYITGPYGCFKLLH